MKRLIVAASFAVVPAILAAQSQTPKPAAPAPAARVAPAAPAARVAPVAPATSHEVFGVAEQNALVKQYCTGCHSDRGKAGNLTLASFDAAKSGDADHLETTEKMIRKLRAGMMPPSTAKRPEADQIKAFYTALEQRVDRAALVNPNPGSRPFQRLNRAEYGRAVKDILGIDIDVASLLPADTLSNGFDNVADSQAFSTTLMESYLRAAAKVTALAIGDKNAPATVCRRCTRSPLTAITSSRWSCTATRAVCCSAARTRASRSRCRSTASAR